MIAQNAKTRVDAEKYYDTYKAKCLQVYFHNDFILTSSEQCLNCSDLFFQNF